MRGTRSKYLRVALRALHMTNHSPVNNRKHGESFVQANHGRGMKHFWQAFRRTPQSPRELIGFEGATRKFLDTLV